MHKAQPKFIHERENTAPFVYHRISNETVFAGEEINIDLANTFMDFGDSENELTYSLTGLKGVKGLYFDPDIKTLVGITPDSGIFNLTLTATDTQGLTGSTDFVLGVHSKNPKDPSQWNFITLTNPPLPIPPKNKNTDGVNFGRNQETDLLMKKENVMGVNGVDLTLSELGLGDERILMLDLMASKIPNNNMQFDMAQKFPSDDGGVGMERVIISDQENAMYQKFGEQNQMGVMGI